MTSAIGWAATALFAVSYLFKRPAALRKLQAAGAALWLVYGLLIHALPVVVANILVAGMALWSLKERGAGRPAVAAERDREVDAAAD